MSLEVKKIIIIGIVIGIVIGLGVGGTIVHCTPPPPTLHPIDSASRRILVIPLWIMKLWYTEKHDNTMQYKCYKFFPAFFRKWPLSFLNSAWH